MTEIPDYFDIYSTENILKQQQSRVREKLNMFNSSSHPELVKHRAHNPIRAELSANYVRDIVRPYLNSVN